MYGLSPLPPRQQTPLDVNPDIPAYRVIDKAGFFDDSDHLWIKDSLIYWEGKLSPGLEPINKLGEEKLREYFTYLDKKADEVCEKNGTSHVGITGAFEARRRLQEMDRKKSISVDMDEELPIMRAERNGKRKAHSIHDTRMTPLMGKRGRPKKEEIYE